MPGFADDLEQPSPCLNDLLEFGSAHADGQPMRPTFSYGKGGKLYCYYVSTP